MSEIRVPPHSVDAEQAVLGGLMLDASRLDDVREVLRGEMFYRHDHRLIWEAVIAVTESGKPPDVVTIAEHLTTNGNIQKVGDLNYLGMLSRETPSAANVVAYAEIVAERWVLREVIRSSGDILDRAFKCDNPGELLDSAGSALSKLAESRDRGAGPAPIRDCLKQAIDSLDHRFRNQGSPMGLPTGYTDLDRMIPGLEPDDLVILAGRPSMGKTTFAMNLAENAVLVEKVPTAVFSMEMSSDQLTNRLIASIGRIPLGKIRNGNLEDVDWPKVTSAVRSLSDAPMFIDDSPALTPEQIRSRCRTIKRQHGLGLIVVDYLQLMQTAGKAENRTNEVSEISRKLKSLAKELRCPVIALSQLSREVERRPNKRPQMSDLRESGSIEQDADVIMFVYRDEVYHDDSPYKGLAEIIIGKQRNGPIGKVMLAFLGHCVRFESALPEAVIEAHEVAHAPRPRARRSAFDA